MAQSRMAGSDQAVVALVGAIADAEPHTFTPLHHQLAYQALRSKSYAAAIPILDNDIYKIYTETPPKTDGSSPPAPVQAQAPAGPNTIHYQDILAYFLYGGMIYLAVGNYDRAIRFFELATIYPANNTASKLQVEAYKKWILVNLLHKGKLPALSRNMFGQNARVISVLAKPYETIAEVFRKPDYQKLAQTVDVGRPIWAQDCNVGLISLVLRAHQRFAISSLSKIYTSLPISKIHQLAFPPTTTHNEVYEYISNLIALGQLSATLTAPDADSAGAYLRFVTPAAEGADVEAQRMQLAAQQQAKIEELNEYVKDMTHTLQLTRPYLEALHKSKKKGSGGDGGSNGTANVNSNPFAADEDDEFLESL